MKKLFVGLLISGLFSLGCGQDTAPKGTPPKAGTNAPGKAIAPAPPPARPEDEETKPDEAKPEPKKDDSKKTEPKKDAK
jgi:hypothetical protein